MIFLFELLFFIVLVLIFLYAPGRYLLRIAKFSYSPGITLLLSFGIGITGFLFTAYLFAWVKLEFVAFLIAGFLAVLDRGKSFLELTQNVKKLRKYKIEMLLLVLGMGGMCYLTWRSGVELGGQYYFYDINSVDSVYHLALIGNLSHSFPPEHFGISGISLRGYHFFYDFLLALFTKYFHFSAADLYLRFFPILVSFLFGLSFISLSTFFKWKRAVTRGIIFSVFFLGNFEFYLNYFVHSELLAHIPEGLTQILDPSVPLSVALFISGYILVSTKKKTNVQSILTALVIGVMPMVKVYTGILFFAGLGIALLWALYKKQYKEQLTVLLCASLIAAVVYLPVNAGAGSFVFAPFLYWRHLMEGSAFFQNIHFPVQYQIFEQHANYIRMAFLIAVVGGVFFIETLGWRLPISILYLLRRKNKKIKLSFTYVFWGSVFIIGTIIPILFIQSSSVFNIVQFYWLVIIFSMPFFVFQLDEVLKVKSMRTRIIVWSVIIISCLPYLFSLFKSYSTNPIRIDTDTTSTVKKIRTSLPATESLLILGQKNYTDVPLISALTSHSVYLEKEGIDFASLQKTIYDREQKIDRILALAENCNSLEKKNDLESLIKSTGSKYIVTFEKYPCFQQEQSYKVIYKVNNQQVIEVL